MRRRRASERAQVWQLVAAAMLGAMVVYLLDPERGNRRRKMAAQRAAGVARDVARGLGRAGRYMSHTAAGKREMLTRAGAHSHEPLDDATLAHKVESVLFRDPAIPKGNINVNSEHGIVVIRGEVETSEEIREIEQRVRHIDGVQDVRTLLHLAHTPAPHA